jgi:hypothetical protein
MNPFMLSRRHQAGTKRPARARPVLERLEDRTVLSNYTAASITDLIADINAANAAGGSNTITLVAGNAFTLAAVNNSTDGGNGLPVIATNNNLTIQGNGDTVARSTDVGTPAIRLFDVAAGASLTLANMTLTNGLAFGGTGMDAFGGGIYSSGSLTLTSVALSSNSALGGNGAMDWDQYGGTYISPGGSAFGGGLYVAGGTATLTDSTVSSNSAQGGAGNSGPYTAGPVGEGGGLCVAGGTVTLSNVALSSNLAIGGSGGPNLGVGGDGEGGGLYVASGTVTLTNATLSSNSAQGSGGYIGGFGRGGGVCVASGTVMLTSDTLSSNSAIGGGGSPQYYGPGYGGALYAGGGTVTLRSDTLTGNSAKAGGKRGTADGGGLYIGPAAAVSLDAFTLRHTKTNKPNDISGSYTLIP